MSSDDEQRAAAVHDLEQAIGARSALYIMGKLPVVDWNRLATKDDLDRLRDEMATKHDLRVLSAELCTELHQAISNQTKWFAGFVTTFIALWSGVVLGLAGFIFK